MKDQRHDPGYHRVTGACKEPRRIHLPGEGVEEAERLVGRDYTLEW